LETREGPSSGVGSVHQIKRRRCIGIACVDLWTSMSMDLVLVTVDDVDEGDQKREGYQNDKTGERYVKG